MECLTVLPLPQSESLYLASESGIARNRLPRRGPDGLTVQPCASAGLGRYGTYLEPDQDFPECLSWSGEVVNR